MIILFVYRKVCRLHVSLVGLCPQAVSKCLIFLFWDVPGGSSFLRTNFIMQNKLWLIYTRRGRYGYLRGHRMRTTQKPHTKRKSDWVAEWLAPPQFYLSLRYQRPVESLSSLLYSTAPHDLLCCHPGTLGSMQCSYAFQYNFRSVCLPAVCLSFFILSSLLLCLRVCGGGGGGDWGSY